MSKKKLLIGVAVGAAVGTALGALIAPAKGSTTRKKILQKGTEVTTDAKKKVEKYSDAMMEEYGSLKKRVEKLVKEGKKKAATFTSNKK